ncbi:hypothetical protein C2E23DRAFT_844943 [Lenzites betulinus]|nr:hypothetical protein C2E23DRAFT_844943 [Lenzites betulinus]
MSIPSFAQLIIRVLGLPMPSLFNPLFHVDIRGSTLPVGAALELHLIAKGCYSSSDSDSGTLLDSGPVRIRTVRLMKCLGTLSEHEYLLVEFVSGHGRWPTVLGELRVERSYDPKRGNPIKKAAADVFRASSQSSALPAMSDEEPTPPKDTVTFTCNRHNASRDKVVFRYKFDEASAPSILDFLVAAAALNSHSPDYILPSRQCFWFAGMLLRVLLGGTNVDPKVSCGARGVLISPAFVPSSTDTVLDAEPVLAGRAGTFKKLFKIITKQEIDSLYDSEIKQACELKRAEVNERLEAPRRQKEAARAREETLREDAARNWAKAARDWAEVARLREEALQKASEDAARQAEASRAREEALLKVAQEAACQAEALAEENARLREEIARLKATGTERQGALPLAQ